MKRYVLIACLLLAACAGDTKKDYASSARCHELGYKAGTETFDQCMKDERASRMLKEQREEFERDKQDREDWKQRRY